MDSSLSLSIITATLNERGNVSQFVDRVKKAVGKGPHEIIVVDDNSSDGTIELLEKISLSNPNVRIIVNSQREGLLKSNLRGLKESRGGIKIVMDADLQHPPEMIGNIVSSLERGQDFAVMSRFVHGSQIYNRNPYREYATSLAISLCHRIVPQTRKFKDPISGFFAINANIKVPYEKLYDLFGNQRGYKILVPIIANNVKKKIVELPYYFGNRCWGVSKIGMENLLIPRYLTELSQYHNLFKESVS